jgi:hypothetical protein
MKFLQLDMEENSMNPNAWPVHQSSAAGRFKTCFKTRLEARFKTDFTIPQRAEQEPM